MYNSQSFMPTARWLVSAVILCSACAEERHATKVAGQRAALTEDDAGAPACVAISTVDKTCDGRDDDCDFMIDEDCDEAAAICPAGSNVIEGTDGDDWLIGTSGDDCILGHGGNDEIWGLSGNDVLVGGPGDDTIYGFAGNDVILGGSGSDTLFGDAGNDRLEGGAGNDRLQGGSDADAILGGACNDQIVDDSNGDLLFGDDGADRIVSGNASYVAGGDGVDACDGIDCEFSALGGNCHSDADCGPGYACSIGTRICAPAVLVGDATCDGVDDDCDGKVDEDYAAQVAACGVGECANTGVTSCVAGTVISSCVPLTASATDDSCDGRDNDCDGRTDEAYVPTCDGDGVTSCVNGAVEVHACDDGNACTSDACSAGACTHAAITCDDGNGCTTDSCDGQQGCVFAANPGAACSDANVCTSGDHCDASGGCVGGGVLDPNDGNPCTDDSCDPITGPQHLAAVGRACDDGNACTVSDACDAAGACVATAVRDCNDGVFCNGAEGCDAAVGCIAGPPPELSDGVACTLDACDEATHSILHQPSDEVCNDHNACDGIERCDVLLGCRMGTPLATDDGNPCTVDTCNPATGGIAHSPNDALCDDQNHCTSDHCDVSAGCQHSDTTAACDDGLFCNGVEGCSPASGCVAGVAPVLSDGVGCTHDVCDEAHHTIVHTPDDSACNDNNPCNGVETCNATLDCRAGTPIPVDDGNACTIDTCDPATGQVAHTPNTCNDNNACTDDRCQLPTGCVHANNSRRCKDGSQCTVDDACNAGACFGGGATVCDDFNDCTAESCDTQADHCSYSALADGTACHAGTGSCLQGSCVQGCTPSAHAPSVVAVVDQHAVAGLAFSYFVVGTDADANTLTYASVGTPLPAGLVVDPNTGEIHGTPASAALAGTGDTHGHVIRISDGCFSVDTNAFSFQTAGVPLPQPFALFDFDDVHVSGSTLTSVYGGFSGQLTAGVTTAQPSRVGQRFKFNGTNGYITLGDSTSALKTGGSMTVAMVVDGRAAVGQTYYMCGVQATDAPGTSYAFAYSISPDGRTASYHEDAGTDYVASSTQAAVATGPNELAFVRDASAKAYRFFFDGREDSGGPVGYAANPSDFGNCVVKIGSNDGSSAFANTFMDELAIWHQVLDPNQIATVAWLYRRAIPIQAWISGETSCQGILSADPGSTDGLYLIANGSQTQVVSCSMSGQP